MARNSAAALNASFNSFFASSFSFPAADEDAVAAFAARVPFDTELKSFSSGCFTICTSTSTSRLAAGAFDLGFERLGGGGKSSGSSAPMAYAKYATSTAPAAAKNGVRLAVCCSSCPLPALDEDDDEAAAGTAELAPLFGLDNGSRSVVVVACAAPTSAAAAGGGTTGFTPTCPLVASTLACAAARCSAKTDSCNGNFAAEACGSPLGAAPFIFGGGLYFLGASAVTNFHFPNPTALYPTSFNTDSCNGVFIASTCGNARVRPCGGFALLEIFGVVALAADAAAAFFVAAFFVAAGFFFAAPVLVVVFFVVVAVVGFFVAVAYVATR